MPALAPAAWKIFSRTTVPWTSSAPKWSATWASGRTFSPEVLAERDGAFLIDPHVDAPPQLNPELHQILIVHDGVVAEIRDYPSRAAAEAAFEAMQ